MRISRWGTSNVVIVRHGSLQNLRSCLFLASLGTLDVKSPESAFSLALPILLTGT